MRHLLIERARRKLRGRHGGVHRAVPRALKEVLSWEETRDVQKDWTVAWNGRWFRIDRQRERLSLASKPLSNTGP